MDESKYYRTVIHLDGQVFTSTKYSLWEDDTLLQTVDAFSKYRRRDIDYVLALDDGRVLMLPPDKAAQAIFIYEEVT